MLAFKEGAAVMENDWIGRSWVRIPLSANIHCLHAIFGICNMNLIHVINSGEGEGEAT